MSYQNGPPKIVTDGLVLMLDPIISKSYPGSGNTVYDLSGQSNNGTIYGATYWSDGRGSFYFDGETNNIWMAVPDSLQISGNKTIDMWFKHNATGGDNSGALIRVGLSTDLLYSLFSERQATRYLRFHWYNSGFPSVSSATNLYNLDEWTMGSVVIDGTNCYFYINGSSAGSGTVSTPTPVSASRLGIGATRWAQNAGTTSQDFRGNISSIKIYNKALSATEILQNYNATKYRFSL
jgi:hypothetical protein